MPSVAVEPRYKSFAEILARVGNVPPERILPYPPPGSATPEDAIDPKYVDGRAAEVVGGILVEKTVGVHDEYIAARMLYLLQQFMEQHNLGAVTGSQGGYWFASDTMRMPDASVVLWDSLDDPDDIEERGEAFLRTPPDLVVEVLSPGNTAAEMVIKLAEYAKAGVQLVWYVDPERKEVDVYPKARAKAKVTVGVGGTLDGGSVLPGFILPVAKLFEKRAPAGRKGGKGPKGKPKKG
jgi:Uma2 family endonuclease